MEIIANTNKRIPDATVLVGTDLYCDYGEEIFENATIIDVFQLIPSGFQPSNARIASP
jgi:hypothetical protein